VAAEDFATLAALLADRWELVRPIGRGGMATVYLARDRKHGRDVAVKVLRREISSLLGPERFVQEIQIAAKLSHPHILPLFDSAEVGGYLLYVMPYVAGETLRDRLERSGPLPVAEAVEIARQVASALDYAHGQGVIHRDIKPENILLQSGQAVVADFGIARAIDAAGLGGDGGRMTETGVALGTPFYMSPEQIGGEPATGASDIYSLGCVLYEMLVGRPPFEGTSTPAIFGGHATARVPPLRRRRPEVSRALEQAALRALAKAPEDRFPTGASFAAALTHGPGLVVDRRLVAAGVLIVLGLGAWGGLRLFRGAAGATASVAILYLDNRSRDSTDQYLADGITEEMITRLGNVPRLAVPSRGAVRRYRGRSIDDAAAVGRALGTEYLLNGSLERGGNLLRVRLELADTEKGNRLWGASFDLVGGDILAIEDSVARAVARAVIGRLAPVEVASLTTKPTTNIEAYDHFLRGNFYLSRRTGEPDGRRALQEYQQALAIEPNFPAALARLGFVYGIYANWPWPHPELSRDSLLVRGLSAADQAIARDSSSAEGWLTRGFVLTPGPADADGWDAFRVGPNLLGIGSRCWLPIPECWRPALAALTKAVELAPRNAEAWYQLGRIQHGPGSDSAIARSLALEPDRAVSAWLLGWRYLAQRRFEAAEGLLDSAIALGRRDMSIYSLRLETRLARGDTRGALADLSRLEALGGKDSLAAFYRAVIRVAIDARSGDPSKARAGVDSLVGRYPPERAERRSVLIGLAAALITVGRHDRGLALLDRAVTRPGYVWWGRLTNILWDPVRNDPRFQPILAKVGTPTI
jgi:serine/threonine-protein kinase